MSEARTVSLDEVWDFMPALRRSEAKLMQELMQNEGRFVETNRLNFVVTRRQYHLQHTTSVHICRIRKILPATHMIETNVNRGYRLIRKEASNG